jgi:hypothetical protein
MIYLPYAVIAALLLYHAWAEREWGKERRQLLDRIQFHSVPSDEKIAPVPMGDIEEWNVEAERYGLEK